MKEIEGDINKWKDILCSWIAIINIVKVSKLPKSIYRFNTITIKMSMTNFTELKQIILKFVQNYKRPWIAKIILIKKNKAGEVSHSLISSYTNTILYYTILYYTILYYTDTDTKTDT